MQMLPDVDRYPLFQLLVSIYFSIYLFIGLRGSKHTKIVVGGIVKENEAKSDGPTTNGRSKPVNSRIRSPPENEQPDWNEPARQHHWNQTVFSRWLSLTPRAHIQVVFVDQRGEESTHKHTKRQRNKHQSSGSSTPSFAFLVHNRITMQLR